MARITVEDCLENESNRFSLVRLAARRAKQLLTGKQPVTDTKGNKAVVSALREIADAPWVVVVLNFVFFGMAVLVIRAKCLRDASRLLGRAEPR